MKVRKKFAAALLSVLMVLTLLPAGATATATTGKLTMLNLDGSIRSASTYSAYQVVSFSAGLLSGKTVYTDAKFNADYKNTIATSLNPTSSSDSDVLTAMENMSASSAAKLADALKAVNVGTAPTGFHYYTGVTGGVFNDLPYGYYLVTEDSSTAGNGNILSRPILVSVPLKDAMGITDVTVKVKPGTASLTKKIQVDGNENTGTGVNNESTLKPAMLVDSNTIVKDSAVYYRTLSDLPTYASDAKDITYTVTDTMSKGLTFGGIDKVYIVRPDAAYSVSNPGAFDVWNGNTMVPNNDYSAASLNANEYSFVPSLKPVSNGETSFTLSLTDDNNIKVWGNAGYKLMILYHVNLNDGASLGSVGNPNSANLTYSTNSEGGSTSKTQTKDDTVITYINELIVTKTDVKDSHIKLGGATFELQKQDPTNPNNWTTVETEITADGSGVAKFTRLEQGNYQLKETTAPSGYNTLQDSIAFTVTAQNAIGPSYISNTSFDLTDDQGNDYAAKNYTALWGGTNVTPSDGNDGYSAGTLKIGVKDNAGFTLPGTGGIGTTIFFVSGIAILLLGGCLALVYTKKRKNTGSHFQH